MERLLEFQPGRENTFYSPIIQMLEIALEFAVDNVVRNLVSGTPMSKQSLEKLVWERAWVLEKAEWDEKVLNNKYFDLISRATTGPGYSIWWSIADCDQSTMKHCEVIFKLITHTSLLKSDDCRLKKLPFGSKMRNMCDLCSLVDANHVIMQCPKHESYRVNMFYEINTHYDLENGECTLEVMLRNYLANKDFDEMLHLWNITCQYIYMMLQDTLMSRKGVG